MDVGGAPASESGCPIWSQQAWWKQLQVQHQAFDRTGLLSYSPATQAPLGLPWPDGQSDIAPDWPDGKSRMQSGIGIALDFGGAAGSAESGYSVLVSPSELAAIRSLRAFRLSGKNGAAREPGGRQLVVRELFRGRRALIRAGADVSVRDEIPEAWEEDPTDEFDPLDQFGFAAFFPDSWLPSPDYWRQSGYLLPTPVMEPRTGLSGLLTGQYGTASAVGILLAAALAGGFVAITCIARRWRRLGGAPSGLFPTLCWVLWGTRASDGTGTAGEEDMLQV
ncbi:hypothetical protein T492DRAFT_44565 [Pavlovales sp. CCMP2436]|nr:hypothetical protein T492DRAFT_44565 [Pavlovales sp. CCMP2436]